MGIRGGEKGSCVGNHNPEAMACILPKWPVRQLSKRKPCEECRSREGAAPTIDCVAASIAILLFFDLQRETHANPNCSPSKRTTG